MPYYPPPSSSSGSYLPLSGGTMTGTITSTIGTITANTPALSATQTWNAAATFTGIFLNVTNTNSNAFSKLIDLQVGGTSILSVDPVGQFLVTGSTAQLGVKSRSGGVTYAWFSSSGSALELWNGGAVQISLKNSGSVLGVGGSNDIGIARNASGVLEVNNYTAGTLRDIKVRSIIIDGAPSTSGAGQIAIGADTRTTIGANGAASALTALPLGYIDIDIAGTLAQIPYYSRGA